MWRQGEDRKQTIHSICAMYIILMGHQEDSGTASAEQGPKPASIAMFTLAILASCTLRREKKDFYN